MLLPFSMTPELCCLMGVPLDATEWHTDRAFGDSEWHGSRHMRSCRKMLCHSTPPAGTQTAHSASPSGAPESRKSDDRTTPRQGARTGGRGHADANGIRRQGQSSLRRNPPRSLPGGFSTYFTLVSRGGAHLTFLLLTFLHLTSVHLA